MDTSPSFLLSDVRVFDLFCNKAIRVAKWYPNSWCFSRSRPRISTNRCCLFDIRVRTANRGDLRRRNLGRGPNPRRSCSGDRGVPVRFAPTAAILEGPHGLGETGEILVGSKDVETIRLVLPPRMGSPGGPGSGAGIPVARMPAGSRGCLASCSTIYGRRAAASWSPTGRWGAATGD